MRVVRRFGMLSFWLGLALLLVVLDEWFAAAVAALFAARELRTTLRGPRRNARADDLEPAEPAYRSAFDPPPQAAKSPLSR